MTLRVFVGPCAIREGGYWRGYATGTRPCPHRRRTPDAAIRDAYWLETTGTPKPPRGVSFERYKGRRAHPAAEE